MSLFGAVADSYVASTGWAASSGSVTPASAKTSSATYTSGAISANPGDVIVLGVAWDNLTTTTPTISATTPPTVPATETASWITTTTANSQSGTSGGAFLVAVIIIRATVTWTAFQPVITLTGAVTAKVSTGVVRSGGSTTVNGQNSTRSSIGTPSTASAVTANAGDLCVGFEFAETATISPADSDTTGGAWVPESTIATSGGGDTTNLSVRCISKIPTVTGVQTLDFSVGVSTDSCASLLALAPA